MWTPLLLLSISLLVTYTAATNVHIKVNDDPAEKLVDVISKNITAPTALHNNPGLECIALQYIEANKGDCDTFGGPDAKKSADSENFGTFAPKCGVQASSLASLTGYLLGCLSKNLSPDDVFSELLTKNDNSIEIITNKKHTEVGAARSVSESGSSYYWCVLFSNGTTTSSLAVKAGAPKVSISHLWQCVLSALVLVGYFLWL